MDRQPLSRATSAASRRGVTLLEILVVMGVIAILATLTVPEFLKTIRRSRIEGAAQTMTRLLLEARAEAIYRGVPVIVTPDRRDDGDWLVAWVDVDEDGKYDCVIDGDGTFTDVPKDDETRYDAAGEERTFREFDYPLFEWQLPIKGNQVSDVRFWSAATATPQSIEATVVDQLDKKPVGATVAAMDEADGYGDWERGIVFLDNGGVVSAGALRIGMGAWEAGDKSVNFLELRIEAQASGRVELRKWIPEPHGEYEPKGFVSSSYDQHGVAYEWEWY